MRANVIVMTAVFVFASPLAPLLGSPLGADAPENEGLSGAPSLELLEFLGSFATDDGHDVDAQELDALLGGAYGGAEEPASQIAGADQ